MIVSSYTPRLGSGRGTRTYGLVRALLVHGPVDLVWVPFGGDGPAAEYRALDGLRLHRVPPGPRARRVPAYVRHRLRGVPGPVARGTVPGLAGAVERLLPGADRVVADDPMAATALARLAARRPVVYSAHNLESAFRRDWGPADRVRRFEARLLRRSAEVWMPSRADADEAAALAPGTAVRLVPNVVDVARIEPVAPRGRDLLYVADLTYAPNREGLRWLVDEVLPRVRRDVGLVVAGRGLPPSADLGPRVRVLGFVDDLGPVYAGAACAVVPLLTGGGSPLKFVEALAHALPVVATPHAARGLDAVAGVHHLEGDGPGGFAAAVERALDPAVAQRLGRAGRALAEAEYSVAALAGRLAPAAAPRCPAGERG